MHHTANPASTNRSYFFRCYIQAVFIFQNNQIFHILTTCSLHAVTREDHLEPKRTDTSHHFSEFPVQCPPHTGLFKHTFWHLMHSHICHHRYYDADFTIPFLLISGSQQLNVTQIRIVNLNILHMTDLFSCWNICMHLQLLARLQASTISRL